MADEKKNPLGPVGAQTQNNVRRLREARGMTKKQLSERVGEIGRTIPPLGVSRIEAGTRRIDVDDLLALAVALNVSPAALFLPPAWRHGAAYLSDSVRLEPRTAWLWAEGKAPAVDVDPVAAEGNEEATRPYFEQYEQYKTLTLPAERRQAANHPANREAEGLAQMVDRLVQVLEERASDATAVKRSLRATRLRLRKLEAELEQMELTAEELGDLAGGVQQD